MLTPEAQRQMDERKAERERRRQVALDLLARGDFSYEALRAALGYEHEAIRSAQAKK